MTAQSITVTCPLTAADVAKQQREIEEDLPEVLAFRVVTEKDYSLADEVLSDLARKSDALVAMRQSATRPMKQAAATIEGWFRPVVGALATAQAHLKAEIGAYRVRLLKAEADARAAAADAVVSGDAAALTQALTEASSVVAPRGNARIRFVWKVSRIAEDLLPDEYWCPDLDKIANVARAAGGSELAPVIPGVIFERVPVVGAKR